MSQTQDVVQHTPLLLEEDKQRENTPFPLKIFLISAQLKTEKKNYKQGLVQKLYIHTSLMVKALWKTKSTGCSKTR